MSKKYDAVILAGGRSPWMKQECGTDIRCLAEINNKRILDYLTEALRASGRIKRIMLAAPENAVDEQQLPEGVEICAAAGDMPSTAKKAAEALENTEKLLFVCDDIPLLSSAAINDFLDQCEQYPEKQVFYPIIPEQACKTSFPEGKRTYVKLADGVFTGGNMMIIDAAIIPKGLAKAREIYGKRKKPFELCKWLGWSFILKFLLRRLDTEAAEKRTTQLLDLPSKVIVTDYAEVGMDVDKAEDWQLIKKYLTQK